MPLPPPFDKIDPSKLPLPDVNNLAKQVVCWGVGNTPYVGGLFSGVLGVLWPDTPRDVWGEIREHTERLIDKKISEEVYARISNALDGLGSNLRAYQKARAAPEPDPVLIKERFEICRGHFNMCAPDFLSKHGGHERVLLPLAVQMATMHLGLLREGAVEGAKFNLSPGTIEDLKKEWIEVANGYKAHYGTFRPLLELGNDSPNGVTVAEYKGAFSGPAVRGATLWLFDQFYLWQFLDPNVPRRTAILTHERYWDPQLTKPVRYSRKLYSDPCGSWLGRKPVLLPERNNSWKESERIAAIDVWGADRIDAVQLHRTDGSSSGRMGNSNGGSKEQREGHGGTFESTKDRPIVGVWGSSGDVLESLGFIHRTGYDAEGKPMLERTHRCGGRRRGGNPFEIHFPGHVLSDVKITGVSNFYGSVECALFVFMPETFFDPQTP